MYFGGCLRIPEVLVVVVFCFLEGGFGGWTPNLWFFFWRGEETAFLLLAQLKAVDLVGTARSGVVWGSFQAGFWRFGSRVVSGAVGLIIRQRGLWVSGVDSEEHLKTFWFSKSPLGCKVSCQLP